jgi:AcrR family transcriptional regulator
VLCEAGFHAVSVDSIVEDAGVARMTLYKNFGSKEDLIVATLRREDKMFRQWLVSSVEGRSSHPEDRILGLFEALHDRFAAEGYYGCAFIRASIEYPAPSHPVHRAAREHKEMIRSYLRGLVADVHAADPVTLAAASLGPQSSAMRQKAPSRGSNKRAFDPSRPQTGMER